MSVLVFDKDKFNNVISTRDYFSIIFIISSFEICEIILSKPIELHDIENGKTMIILLMCLRSHLVKDLNKYLLLII